MNLQILAATASVIVCGTVALGTVALGTAAAKSLPLSPGWVADPVTGCKAWSMRTGDGASFSWDGGCEKGFASGKGTLLWVNGSRYDGEMKDGRYDGRGTFVGVNGIRYVGEWKDYRPNGMGTLTRADGVSFTGVWRNGCFRQGPRWSVFLTTAKECGFE